MRTVSIFRNGKNQAVRLPADMAFEGVGELEISRTGDVITLRPARPTWRSFLGLSVADGDLLERQQVISNEAPVASGVAYMLDTATCVSIIQNRPESIIELLSAEVEHGHRIVISVITYAELRRDLADTDSVVEEFLARLDAVLPWDQAAANAMVQGMGAILKAGVAIGYNFVAVAGHAVAARCVLITKNDRELRHVPGLIHENWVEHVA